MKKLFLCSSFKDVAMLLEPFAGDVQGKRITFIPTASNVEKIVFYVDAGKKALQKLGFFVDEMDVATASSEEIAKRLEQNDAIYISGGNTFFLMQEIQKTGTGKCILEQVEKGKLYVGESAGAMIAAPRTEYAKAMDSPKKAPELDSFEGLNLVNFYPLPHYNSFPFKKATEKIMETYGGSITLRPMTNQEALLIRGDDIATERKPEGKF